MPPTDNPKACAAAGGVCPAHTLDRRQFLTIAGTTAGAVALAGAAPGCSPGGQVAAGNVSALSVGTLLVMSDIAVARDDTGVYALTTICTHQGCIVQDTSRTIA